MSIEIKAWKCEQCEKAYLNKMSAEDCCKEKPKSICRICGIEVERSLTHSRDFSHELDNDYICYL